MIGSSPRFLTYRTGTSLLHRLDARTKLLCTMTIVADALICNVPWGMGVAYALAALFGLQASHLLPSLWRALRPLAVLIALFSLLIVVATPGKALAHIWIMVPTREGVALAIRLGLQAFLIVYTTSLLTLTTPPLAIADALQWALGWLERFKVPIRDVIAMVAIGLTFVPLLMEAQRVLAAQRARGADLNMIALMDEEAMGALLIPLLLGNLRRGEDLAESMEARLFATGPRTSFVQTYFRRIDILAAAVVAAATTAIIVLAIVV